MADEAAREATVQTEAEWKAKVQHLEVSVVSVPSLRSIILFKENVWKRSSLWLYSFGSVYDMCLFFAVHPLSAIRTLKVLKEVCS